MKMKTWIRGTVNVEGDIKNGSLENKDMYKYVQVFL